MKLLDALNRIERAGKESSLTTQKLIESTEIALRDLYTRLGDCPFHIYFSKSDANGQLRMRNICWNPSHHAIETFDDNEPEGFDYIAYESNSPGGLPGIHIQQVDREFALDFSAWAAAGGLGKVAEKIEAEEQRHAQALAEI